MSDELSPKAYDSTGVEDGIYTAWLKSGYFSPENLPDLDARKDPYCISLPPPNVTGTLHIGHAVMLAIEDAMIRFARMRGKRALWIPGTDHAAIATQTKVEKVLVAKGYKDPRKELGREKFLEQVHAFAQSSHDTITSQMKKMGVSVDWEREAYTLDDKRNLAVRTAFTRMHNLGLIDRGYKVINWDPIGQTTVSDDEVEHKVGKTTLYTFTYNKDFPIPIATTRPETKVGDTAVAVHPDGKWKKYVGKTFENIEFAGTTLTIKVVADHEVDPEFGTGALGVTPAHSIVDAEIAHRHELEMIQVIGEDAKMNAQAGALLADLSITEARKKVVQWLQENDLLIGEQEVEQSLSVAQRSGGIIEPLPKSQWFIHVNKPFPFTQSKHNPIKGLETGQQVTLKELMSHVVRSGEVKIIPQKFEKVYFDWIDHLRDWCISRQIWFGHRIPVWYKQTTDQNKKSNSKKEHEERGEIFVGIDAPHGDGWVQDPDTLDTWFSSGLWTFSILGWPDEEAEDLKRYHPNAVMETGYDILFFWIARMILMSTSLLGEVPFKDVYLHGLVRDEQGRKMSKSLDNAIDPLDAIKEYGADATRLSMMIGQTPGNDTKLSSEKIASYRNFTNKLWNISRFVFMSADKIRSVRKTPQPQTCADAWILGRFSEVIDRVTRHFDAYEFSLAGELLRDFTWGEFADWYVEIAKVQKQKNAGATDDILLYILERLLMLWHPLMPFVTEELYKKFDSGMLMVAKWPECNDMPERKHMEAFSRLQEIIVALRTVRSSYGIAYSEPMDVIIVGAQDLEEQEPIVTAMVKTGTITWSQGHTDKPEGAMTILAGGATLYIPLQGLIDVAKERTRIEKELEHISVYLQGLEQKLANTDFVQQAPQEIVQMQRARAQEARDKQHTLKQELEHLS